MCSYTKGCTHHCQSKCLTQEDYNTAKLSLMYSKLLQHRENMKTRSPRMRYYSNSDAFSTCSDDDLYFSRKGKHVHFMEEDLKQSKVDVRRPKKGNQASLPPLKHRKDKTEYEVYWDALSVNYTSFGTDKLRLPAGSPEYETVKEELTRNVIHKQTVAPKRQFGNKTVRKVSPSPWRRVAYKMQFITSLSVLPPIRSRDTYTHVHTKLDTGRLKH